MNGVSARWSKAVCSTLGVLPLSLAQCPIMHCLGSYLVALGRKAFGDIGELGDGPASTGELRGIKALEHSLT